MTAFAKRLSFVDDINRRVTLVIALIAVALVGLNYLISVREARAQVDDRADEVIVAITEAFRLPFWDHNLSNAMEIATAFSTNDWVAYVRIRDAAGRPVAGVGMRSDAVVFRDGLIKYGEQLVGHVSVGLTLRPLSRQIENAVRNSLAMLAVVVAALYLLNRTFLRRGLQRPVSLLLERIHRIAQERYEAPDRDVRHTEIREVIQQFDVMARKVEQRERSYADANLELQSAQAELRRHGELLEQTVLQRTQALEDEVQMRRRTELELLAAKQSADRANRAKSDFVAQMSHELRTPLNGILGCVQMLHAGPPLAAAQTEALETLRQCAEHLLELINEILDIAKIEAGRMELDEHDFSLPRMLLGVQRMIRPRALGKGLGFTLNADTSALPDMIHADERKLRQILINLLGNAVKFTRSGSVELRVSCEGARLRFEVIDTGPGIRPEALDGLFEPFAQLHDPAARDEGTGLGLAISQRLAGVMGSELRVHNDWGHGCSFAFELLLAEPVATALPPVAGEDDAQPSTSVTEVLAADARPTELSLPSAQARALREAANKGYRKACCARRWCWSRWASPMRRWPRAFANWHASSASTRSRRSTSTDPGHGNWS